MIAFKHVILLCAFNFILCNKIKYRRESYQIILPENADKPYVKWVETIPKNLTEVTLCYWVNFHTISNECDDVFSYSLPNSDKSLASAICEEGKKSFFYVVSNNNQSGNENKLHATGVWELNCNTRSTLTGQWVMYPGGRYMRYETRRGVSEAFVEPIPGLGVAYLGSTDGGFRGQISQLNIWDYILRGPEILSLARCEIKMEGNILSWSKASWEPFGGAIVAPVALPCTLDEN